MLGEWLKLLCCGLNDLFFRSYGELRTFLVSSKTSSEWLKDFCHLLNNLKDWKILVALFH